MTLYHHRAEGAQNGRRFLLVAPYHCTPNQLQSEVWRLFLFENFQLVHEVGGEPYGVLYSAAIRYLEEGVLP